MTVGVSHASQSTTAFHGQVNSRGLAEFTAGQIVSVNVQRRLNEQNYVVTLRGKTREVRSEHALPVGDTIDAVVVSATDKLELRRMISDAVISTGDAQEAISSLTVDNQGDVAAQASFYKCKFDKNELRTLQQAVQEATDPNSMMLAGLFLSKRGVAVDPTILQQLYAMQTVKEPSEVTPGSTLQPRKEADNNLTMASLALAMREVIETHAGEMTHSITASERKIESSHSVSGVESASDNINTSVITMQASTTDDTTKDDVNRKLTSISALHDLISDVDANGLGVRYGTLPVLINGELVELELVMFKHRQKETDAEPIRRLVMSIHTQSLGTVSITAEALNQRLLVNISAQTTDHAETLGAYADDVRLLAQRFGWKVESVAYEVKAQGVKLVQRVMEHSIRQGVIDHVW